MNPIIASLILLAVCIPSQAEEAMQLSIRDLLSSPAKYSGHRVIVRAQWGYGFEQSTIYDSKEHEFEIWLEVAKQNDGNPSDKKLWMLQQLLHLQRGISPVAFTDIEIEAEGLFSDWEALDSTKQLIKEAEAKGMGVHGGFGHLSSCRYQLSVTKLRWYRCVIESTASESKANDPKPGSRIEKAP